MNMSIHPLNAMLIVCVSFSITGMCLGQSDQLCRMEETTGCEVCPCGTCDLATERDSWDLDRVAYEHFMVIRVRFVCILNSSNEGATPQQAAEQLDELNEAFLPFKIQFDHVETVSHTSDIHYNFCVSLPPTMTCFCPVPNFSCRTHLGLPTARELDLKDAYAYLPDQILNIYVTDVSASGAGFNGFGYYPWWAGFDGPLNGILVDKDHFGGERCGPDPQTDPQVCGLLMHEVGHQLGLYHTFDLACGGCEGEENCEETTDLCCDTPPSPGGTQYSCENIAAESCPGGPTPPPSDQSNFMDYAGDGCWSSFTQQQAKRMYCWTCNRLKGWIDSPDCNSNDMPDVCDIARATSDDCDQNGVPDDCQLLTMPPAVCCHSGDQCSILTECRCDELSGFYMAFETSCTTSPCAMFGP